MDMRWSAADLQFRDDVRKFIAAELTPDLRKAGRSMTSVYSDYEIGMKWQQILHKQGWVAPAWPVEYGGCGWSVAQRYIFASEMASAGAPPLSPMGIGMCGPVLIGHGTEEQKSCFLPRILSCEDFWCQGYSEPGSGSDLASLQMSAREASDQFICNGHKIWTTHAHVANWIFCLVRTSREKIPQLGITFLLIDMKTPGVDVRPIVSLSGEHIQNEVFFTDVHVPRKNVVGQVGEGWTVAKYLMQFERGGGVSSPGLKSRMERLRSIAQAEKITDDAFAASLAQIQIEVDALEAVELRVMSKLSRGQPPGAESSMLKMVGTELSQRVTELALEAVGVHALPYQPFAVSAGGPSPNYRLGSNQIPVGPEYSWTVAAKYLNDRAGSIYAGTSEVQRNILSKAVLGL
jgi:alkylation response protein AidB-like acyl-CoA dehydrogenase